MSDFSKSKNPTEQFNVDTNPDADLYSPSFALWPGDAPGTPEGLSDEEKKEQIDKRTIPDGPSDRALYRIFKPRLLPFLLPGDKNPAVIIAPGGGYTRVVVDKEGIEAARWLNSLGFSAFVLIYRLPSEGHEPKALVPLQDSQRAMRLVKQRAKEFGIDPEKLGILGFSAGGHLAATLATKYSEAAYPAVDSADALSAKPAFQVLVYPVITLDAAHTHEGTRNRLLGPSPKAKDVKRYSLESQVNRHTAPAFILQTFDDSVPPINAIRYFLALREANVVSELHVYDRGGHGYGLRQKQLPVGTWTDLCAAWLQAHRFC